ncbi:helix-turn-helix domain-containing protein [Lewinella cohaerens]|uniref:helix-turn-helix domain-containing protein n=1 Tax=Lewinella cohaerens TaxID=70995 RepID=UPI000381EBF2|nr:helix-turn-helix transcriptional regulator [Lewinella cohaerens]
MKNVIHLLKINEVKGFEIYCVFSNGEYRVIDILKFLNSKELKSDSILRNLYDEDKVKNVIIKNATLTWPDIKKVTRLSNGMEFEVELDLDPVVLYENSKIDKERDSAYQLGRALKKARISAGITQEELAQKVGTSKSYISKIENSRSDIGYKTLRKIIEVGLNKRIVIE